MALSNVTTDLRYPMPGDVVSVQATCSVGTQYRVRLTAKPAASALECFDDAKQNHLTLNRFAPDVGGRYTLTVIEETVTFDPPRFEGDFGDATLHGGTAARGVLLDPVQVDTATLTVSVGESVRRGIGVAPDTIDIHACAHEVWGGVAETFWQPTDATAHGALTACVDATRCPRITTDNASDAARIAASDSTVVRALRDIGGVPTAAQQYGDEYDETHAIMPWNLVISNPYDEFAWTVRRFNRHVAAVDVKIHSVADAANTLVVPVSSSLADQITFLNALRVALLAHVQYAGVGDPHTNEDSITFGHLAVTGALDPGASQDEACDRCNLLWWCLDEHLTRLYSDTAAAYQCHLTGDARLDDVTYPKATDATTAHARNVRMRAVYEAHRINVALYALGDYHNAAGTSAETFSDALPTDRDSFVAATGKLLTKLRDHLLNMSAAGASTSYHLAADTTLAAIASGSPATFEDAVAYAEMIQWILATHAAKGPSVHAYAHAGDCAPTRFGVERIHHAFRTALLTASGLTPPANENYAATKFVMVGGFGKE